MAKGNETPGKCVPSVEPSEPTPRNDRPSMGHSEVTPSRGDTPLTELKNGQTGLISTVENQGEAFQRILDLGFTPGTSVRAIFRAPLGEPIVFQVRGYRIGLRRCEAEMVHVKFEQHDF